MALSFWMPATLWVPAQMCTPPFGNDSLIPPGWPTTSSAAASSDTMVKTASPKVAAALIELTALAPASVSGLSLAGVRL